ncbi:MAG: hypothetical protein Ct9H300mP6_09070 [Gammaproteobacteria bacterium]|nr:MAG: hypothetical protein Ct9H300mP6_09070 [Gammaproteobacteria bacterium]
MFFPKRKVRVAIPFGFFIQILKLPAFVVLIFWFVLQLIKGASAGSGGGVAFGAHFGRIYCRCDFGSNPSCCNEEKGRIIIFLRRKKCE